VSLRDLRARLPGCVVHVCHDAEAIVPSKTTEIQDAPALRRKNTFIFPPAPGFVTTHHEERDALDDEWEQVGESSASPPVAAPTDAKTTVDAEIVFLSKTGSCYHDSAKDAGKHPSSTTRGKAEQAGKVPCRRCYAAVATPVSLPPVPVAPSSSSPTHPPVTRIFFYDLEANAKKNAHQTRQMAVRSLDNSVVWSRDVDDDFGAAWAECEALVDPTGRDAIFMFAHNGRCFDVPILTREFETWKLRPRSNWTFCDSLPHISRWLRELKTGRVWKCSMTSLTHGLLRSSVHESNASLVDFWSPTIAFTTKPSAHEAAFDCLVLRSIFLMAFASHLLCRLTTRNHIVSVAAIEDEIHEKLKMCYMEGSLDTLIMKHMAKFD